MGRRTIIVGLVLLAAGGCAPDMTALMLHVCLDPAVNDAVENVRLVVDAGELGEEAHVFAVPAGASEAQYSLRPGVELSDPLELELQVVGLTETGTERISRDVIASFEPDEDRDVWVSLEEGCLGVFCPDGETCGETGSCRAVSTADESACPEQ